MSYPNLKAVFIRNVLNNTDARTIIQYNNIITHSRNASNPYERNVHDTHTHIYNM